jgi:hypothetical protein
MPVLSNTVTTSHMWLLSIEQWLAHCLFYFTLINLSLNSHMGLGAIVTDSTNVQTHDSYPQLR